MSATRAPARPARGKGGRLCYRTKRDMTRALVDANLHVTEPCEPDSTGASFDPVNHKYNRRGKRKVTDCPAAIKVASPTKPPYCLDRVDLKTLNELEVAKRTGGFRLPPAAQDLVTARQLEEHYRDQAEALEAAGRDREPGEDDDAPGAGAGAADFDFPSGPAPEAHPPRPGAAPMPKKKPKKKNKAAQAARKRPRKAPAAAPAPKAPKTRKTRQKPARRPSLPWEVRVTPPRLRRLLKVRRYASQGAAVEAAKQLEATLRHLKARGWSLGVYGPA